MCFMKLGRAMSVALSEIADAGWTARELRDHGTAGAVRERMKDVI